MAIFNPSPNPTNDPDYKRDFSAIDVPGTIQRQGQRENSIMPEGVKQGDKSGEYIGLAAGSKISGDAAERKGYGDIFSSVVNAGKFGLDAAEALVKDRIQKEIYERGKEEQDKYIEELQGLVTRPAAQYAQAQSTSILDANASADMPEEVDGLPGDLETLQAASPGAGGRFRTTGYDARLLTMAKDMRRKYPGYKQFIDDNVTKVSGRDSANRMISSMASAINENMASTKQEKNKVLSFISTEMGKGNPVASRIYELFDKGAIDKYTALDKLSPWIVSGAKLQRMEATRQAYEGQVTWDKNRAEEELDFNVTLKSAAFLENLKVSAGPGLPEENFDELMKRHQNGEIPAAQWNVIGGRLKGKLVEMEMNLQAEARSGGRNSLSNSIGGARTNAVIKERMGLLRNAVDAITAGDFPLANSISRQLKASIDDTQMSLYRTPGIGAKVQGMEVFRKSLGDGPMVKIVTDALTKKGPDGKTLDEGMTTWVDSHVAAMATQDRKTKGGTAITPKEILSGADPRITPEARKELISRINTVLADPTIPDIAKANLAEAWFGDGNKDFIGRIKIAEDHKDKNGNVVPGRFTTFMGMTNPKILDAMHKIGGDTWKNTVDWVETTWGKDLFIQDIQQLNKLQHDNRLLIGWNSDKKEFYSVISHDGSAGHSPAYGGPAELKSYQDRVDLTLGRLNQSLKAVSNIAKVEGKDVESYIFKTLQKGDWQPNAEVRGLPQEIYNAIIASKVREEVNKQARDKSSKAWQGKE